jgi:uncharacterized protein YndB with AHSA1/START domain
MGSTHITRHLRAPRSRVYAALIDADAVAQWMVPNGMTSKVHAFDSSQNGQFRISLTYDVPDTGNAGAGNTPAGKTSAHTDTYHGRFAQLVPNERVVQVIEFETENPALGGEMTITITLSDADGGTQLVAVHDNLPSGVPLADNELGWQLSLAKLAALVECAPSG